MHPSSLDNDNERLEIRKLCTISNANQINQRLRVTLGTDYGVDTLELTVTNLSDDFTHPQPQEAGSVNSTLKFVVNNHSLSAVMKQRLYTHFVGVIDHTKKLNQGIDVALAKIDQVYRSAHRYYVVNPTILDRVIVVNTPLKLRLLDCYAEFIVIGIITDLELISSDACLPRR
jgi:hypothetical protein